MLELNNQLTKTNFESEREPITRQLSATNKKIDVSVHELYEPNKEKIKIEK